MSGNLIKAKPELKGLVNENFHFMLFNLVNLKFQGLPCEFQLGWRPLSVRFEFHKPG